MNTFL